MTTIEKIEKIVLPSLRKGLEMEEKATPGPWKQGGKTPEKVMPLTTYSGVSRSQWNADVAHAWNEWHRQTEGLILAIEGYLHGTGSFWPKEVRDYCQSNLQSIANLWPGEE